MGIKDIVYEFLRFKSGLVGVFLLLIIVGLAVAAPVISDEEAGYRWYDIEWWVEKNIPKGVPPEWVAIIEGREYASTYETSYSIIDKDRFKVSFNLTYEMTADVPPTDIILYVNVSKAEGAAEDEYIVILNIYRPDGTKLLRVLDFRTAASLAKITISTDDRARDTIISFMRQYDTDENFQDIVSRGLLDVIDVVKILFSEADEGVLLERTPPLKGEYIFEVELFRTTPNIEFNEVRMVVLGSAYGIFGTDSFGRDIFVGIIWGARIALVLGLVVAIVSVLIGVVYGTVSAYVGGWTDEVLQRIQEFAISIPLLPLLLILAYTFKPTIWNLILLLIVFSWPGPVKTIRSMALQIREQLYITAAKAVGASTSRIVLRYILPQILPYTFALVAFAVPGAILTEAGVSFLLGAQGTLEITWGRILSDAERKSAVLTGMWWWVLPPGFMIAISGLAFVLIGTALDRVLNPRLLR